MRELRLVRFCNHKFVCGVEIDENGIIKNTAPFVKRFKYQHISRLEAWVLRTFGGTVEYL